MVRKKAAKKVAKKIAKQTTTKVVKKAAKKAPARAASVRLLSGGNPQIPKGDGDVPVQAYIAAMPGWKRAVGERLDALIERTLPKLAKAVKWNSPLYGVPGKGWFLGVHCFDRYIKVAFFKGADFEPPLPVGSKDPHTRYVHLVEDEPMDEKLMAKWIRQGAKGEGWVV